MGKVTLAGKTKQLPQLNLVTDYFDHRQRHVAVKFIHQLNQVTINWDYYMASYVNGPRAVIGYTSGQDFRAASRKKTFNFSEAEAGYQSLCNKIILY